jgi:hypothetical protein
MYLIVYYIIVKMAKASRLRWLGHFYRCEKSNPCKELTFTKPEGVRERGKPPVRWIRIKKKICVLWRLEAGRT